MYYAWYVIPRQQVLTPELEVEVAFRGIRRILPAKPGLDGHDLVAKVMAHALKEPRFEVIYTGVHQTVEMMAQSAIQEDADAIGLSITSGAHMLICRKLLQLLKENGVDDMMVAVGGVIPSRDIAHLKEMGVAAVFQGGSDIDAPAEFLWDQFKQQTS